MKEKILCVDDERNILEGFQRYLRRNFDIDIATSGALGLEMILERGPYAVVVSDMRMPEMDGVEFLSTVKKIAPQSVRVMLTGNADQQTAIDAINEGAIFRFLTKPCSPEMLASTLQAGIEQYRLIVAEIDILEKTLRTSIELLTEILAIINPTAFSRGTRARKFATQIAVALKLEDAWQVEIAAMLSQIGCLAIPEDTLHRACHGQTLDAKELKLIQGHPQKGFALIHRIPRLEPVAEIIAYQEKLFNGAGIPADHLFGSQIPRGARILKVALDYDKLQQQGFPSNEALQEIERRQDWYDPEIVRALKAVLTDEKSQFDVRSLSVRELQPGMILDDDVVSLKRMMLVPKGQVITRSLRMHLLSFLESGMIADSINVRVPAER